ncbi:uncharacterized protein PG986_009632 [Apiospora aurea]|uniref:Uncharacterized protein n=1 Tax=Apiospora aurea TaxID=335848 RepID=A0ABR1Q9I7_9PEZI
MLLRCRHSSGDSALHRRGQESGWGADLWLRGDGCGAQSPGHVNCAWILVSQSTDSEYCPYDLLVSDHPLLGVDHCHHDNGFPLSPKLSITKYLKSQSDNQGVLRLAECGNNITPMTACETTGGTPVFLVNPVVCLWITVSWIIMSTIYSRVALKTQGGMIRENGSQARDPKCKTCFKDRVGKWLLIRGLRVLQFYLVLFYFMWSFFFIFNMETSLQAMIRREPSVDWTVGQIIALAVWVPVLFKLGFMLLYHEFAYTVNSRGRSFAAANIAISGRRCEKAELFQLPFQSYWLYHG